VAPARAANGQGGAGGNDVPNGGGGGEAGLAGGGGGGAGDLNVLHDVDGGGGGGGGGSSYAPRGTAIVTNAGTPAQVTITCTFPGVGTTTTTTTTTTSTTATTSTTTTPSVPALSAARLGSNRFAATKGTRLMLTLSRPATIAVVVSRTVTGHRVRGVCKPTAKKGKRCTISVKERTLIFQALRGGTRSSSRSRGSRRVDTA
jgi:hypothetical protein